MIIDTHSHYDDEQFEADRDELLLSMQKNGVEKVIEVASTLESLKAVKELIERYPFVYGASGLHPDDVVDIGEAEFETVKALCRHEKVVAVGEVGLDYYWMKETKEKQIYWFERFLALAQEEKLPVILHSREAAADTLETVKRAGNHSGVMHCFSYTKEMAKEYLDLGMYIGVGGVITFKNAKKLKEAVEYLPLDAILLETDCPYLAPEPYRGKRNSSLYLPYVAEEIARIKHTDAQTVIDVTAQNARRLFGL